MRLTATILALALPLMAAKCDEQLRSVLTQTCDALDVAYAHYDAVVASGVLKTSTITKVALVREQTNALCTNPGSASTVSITAVAARAYVVLNAAFREGGTLRDAKMGYTQVENLRGILEEARRK